MKNDGTAAPVSAEKILNRVAQVAFGEETKDADRLRALDWLSEKLAEAEKDGETMEKLEEILKKLEAL